MSFTGACGVGVSDVYMLKRVGDMRPPCGTPFLNCSCLVLLSLCVRWFVLVEDCCDGVV